VPLASQLAQGPATAAVAAAQPAASEAVPATPETKTDTTARTADERAELRKKQQDDERRRQEEARQAQILQQQQLAQQPRPGTQPAVLPPAQPAPQPQQVAVAQPQRPAAQPVAPPPPPPPAPAEEPAAVSANTVFDEDVVEERPRLTNINELQRALQDRYPAQLYANHVAGRVTASFVVGADGRVDGSSIRILSSPNPGFNVPTQSVLRRARFRPARVKGQAVRVQVTMPIAWTIDQ
jgi:TonB family protein